MAAEHRRVSADTEVHARALADNLSKQGFALEEQQPAQWTLRKRRRRGDQIVTIAIARPWQPDGPARSGGWAPPSGPPAT